MKHKISVFTPFTQMISNSNHTVLSKFEWKTKLAQIIPGPDVIKLFSCSTQLSMKIFLLNNVKMPTIVGILTFMSRKNLLAFKHL